MVNWLRDILVSSRNHVSIFRCSSCAAPTNVSSNFLSREATAFPTMSYPLREKSSKLPRPNINILKSSSDNSRSDCVAAGLIYSSKIPGVMTSTLISGRLL